MIVGVLGMQGAFREHIVAVQKLGVEAIVVKTIEDLNRVHGLIIPGGESTTIGKLARLTGLADRIIERANEGMPIFGTCAGMILLAKNLLNYPDQYTFKLMDITVERNAYGRQVESFEVDLYVPIFNKKIRAIFIRAPKVVKVGENVKVLAEHEQTPVLVQENNLLASSFHPELSDDLTVHKYFLEMVEKYYGSLRKAV
ncbi:pyridoxal 5'-phosphate synthase glutaminase subunit PdxT [Pseudothermotoga thermarum]|uniref:Pyridoxal 5'-phosphate synthase subunit PdxT n=1 Tax=Pseudothermotoga thermarum DSM 5069 TaxID=688269 RepID=F7YWA1_9THEM|nr:pyridoxal 5'-phosphate synthase glutaminase subunit PdxT [Pseudothermotoga thermarum]AEH51873.1 pyridoxal phosphate synthase yaaE subunit [Pseudothermotoga thermarum DSM 5069]